MNGEVGPTNHFINLGALVYKLNKLVLLLKVALRITRSGKREMWMQEWNLRIPFSQNLKKNTSWRLYILLNNMETWEEYQVHLIELYKIYYRLHL